MRHTLLCALGLFLLNTLLHCGRAEDAVLTLEPKHSTLFTGESVRLTCDMRDGKDSDWSYTFNLNGQQRPFCTAKSCSLKLTKSYSGEYQCTGNHTTTKCIKASNKVTLNISDNFKPGLNVSPSWLSPGDSVTLSCSVKDPSAGWRFYWYKAVPILTNNSYRYELLPGSCNGTEQDFCIVHGQTHTAGYVCRAGRGNPVYYMQYSKPKFVWSGDFQPVSLTVSPDRAQQFSSESVSLSCKGNSAEWRVMRFSEAGQLANCSDWGTGTGSTCNIHKHTKKTSVYWCESRSGQFSNAVNITAQYKDIILVSPVHPVTEGDSVTLGCKLKTENVLTKVSFCKNGKIIQYDTRGELTIPAVSKSDEGLYKCKCSGKESLQSWMSVRSVSRSSSFLLPLIIGLVCGILLIILLLLLCCCRKSKDSYFVRAAESQRTNQSSAPDQVVNQNKTQPKVHSSHLHDADESIEVTYSLIQLKNIRNKEKSSPAVTDETVYSELKLGMALGP